MDRRQKPHHLRVVLNPDGYAIIAIHCKHVAPVWQIAFQRLRVQHLVRQMLLHLHAQSTTGTMTHLLELVERVGGCEKVVHVNIMHAGPKLAAEIEDDAASLPDICGFVAVLQRLHTTGRTRYATDAGIANPWLSIANMYNSPPY